MRTLRIVSPVRTANPAATMPMIIPLRPFTLKKGPSLAGTNAEAGFVLQKQIYCELPPPSKYTALAELMDLFTRFPMQRNSIKELQRETFSRLENVVAEALTPLLAHCCVAATQSLEPAAPVASAATILRQAALVLDTLHYDAVAAQRAITAGTG